MSSPYTERRDLDLAGITAAEVASFNGTIAIATGPAPPRLEVAIRGHATYKIERIGQLLLVVGKKRGLTYFGNGVNFALWLPEGLALKVANINGAIQVHGAISNLEAIASGGDIVTEATGRGNLRLTTTNGTIDARSGQGHVEAASSSGDIRLSNLTGRIEAMSATGSINIDHVGGQLYITNTNGPAAIASADGHVFVNSANGDVHIYGARGQFQITSHNGAVRLEQVEFAADSQNWVSSHNGAIEVREMRAPAGLHLRAKTHQRVIAAALAGWDVRSVRNGMGLKARLAGDHPATLDLVGDGEMRISD